jgi:hypothetical protein
MSPFNSDEDDDVPELILLSSSKKAAAGKRAALLKAQAHDKLQRKEKNRARDRRLKERASSSKRAHLEPETRQADASGSGQIQQGLPLQDETAKTSLPQKIRLSNEDESLNDDVGINNDRLPDHIFAAAFAQKPQLRPKISHKPPSQAPSRQKRPGRTKPSAKEIVLGCV